MAMAAPVMSVGEFIAWAQSQGCRVVRGARVTWRLNGRTGIVKPRYLLNGDKRLAMPTDDQQPLDFYAVWIYRRRLGITAEPT